MGTRKVIVTVFLLGIIACQPTNNKSTEREWLPVRVETVKSAMYHRVIPCSGRLSQATEMKLSFKTGGVIDRIYVKEGKKVKKGDVLAELKKDEFSSALSQISLAIEKAEKDYQRVLALFRDSVATIDQLENAELQLKILKKKKEAALFNYKHASIIAPKDGIVLKVIPEENEIVGAGMPVILFGSENPFWIAKVYVSAEERVKINTGDSALVFIDAFPEDTFYGNVGNLGNFADPYTSNYEVEIHLESNPLFLSGMFVSAHIIIGDGMVYPSVPFDALFEFEDNKACVYKVKKGQPLKTEVWLKDWNSGIAFVKKGLRIGDSIITEGRYYINEQTRIKIMP